MIEDGFRGWAALGALFGVVAVGAAAAGAHLPQGDAAAQRAMASAVQMNGWHALALVACAAVGGGRFTHAAAICFTLGVILFCGTVYGGRFGLHGGLPTAPAGGTLLMLGWALLGISALRG